MLKNIIKFTIGSIVIIALGIGALLGVEYWQYRGSPEYRAYKEAERIKEEVADDPYGGDTPEETLRLFIDALKKGDIGLAAKYFVLDKQDQWRADLAKIQEKGLLDEMVGDFTTAKRGDDLPNGNVIFSVVNQENEVISTVYLIKSPNNKWKLQDL